MSSENIFHLPVPACKVVPGHYPVGDARANATVAVSASIEAAEAAADAEATGSISVAEQVAASAVKPTEEQIAHAHLLTEIKKCRLSAIEQIEEPEPRLMLADKQVATADNLVSIVAKAGSGKSAAVGAAFSAAISAAVGSDADCLGFKAENPRKQAVVVIDTEQCRFDAQLCLRRALRRVDSNEAPAWLENFSLVGRTRSWRRKALPEILAQASANHEGIFAVYLDGVADLVNNVNDIEECLEVIVELRNLSIQFHCPIVCVIHSNEGETAGTKPRGHIGSELMRESETVILLQRDGEVTSVTTLKQRKARVTDADGIAFKWSDAEMRHVSCGSPAKAKQAAKKAELVELAVKCFGSYKQMTRMDLERAITCETGVKGDTPRRRVNEMLAAVAINKGPDGLYNLPGRK